MYVCDLKSFITFDAINPLLSFMLWRNSSYVKMGSMNNLGNGTHLAGALANAKRWMSVSCWPGYIIHRSSFIRDPQPK